MVERSEGPFQGRLWERAKELLTNNDHPVETRGRETGKSELSVPEYLQLVSSATEDGVVTDSERELLEILGNHDNANMLAQRLGADASFDPSGMNFNRVADRHATPAHVIDQGLSGRDVVSRATITTEAQVHEAQATLRAEIAGLTIADGTDFALATRRGRWAIADRLGK